MNAYCTCGAQLPPDARFCHKCGKPQFEMPVQEPDDEPVAPAAAPGVAPAATPAGPAPPLEVNFHNPIAVRTGLLTAVIASLTNSLPIPIPGWLLLSQCGAGFLAVYLYGRRTGQPLTVLSGARMGWITGIFSFMIGIVFFTLAMIAIMNQGGLAAFFKENMRSQIPNPADLDRLIAAMQEPTGLSVIIVLMLILLFVLFTVFPTLGGALAAKVLQRDRA
ncbi:MAG: zinc ribbon domain-containing protein [Bryobacterales bacterium]|nr:zinc ribbon domain-containing protein [Bryobacterales bacterium]